MKLTILEGDVFDRIKDIPKDTIDLAITSPPYWNLRSYGAGPNELGLEPTMEAYLDNTLKWVKEIWRVLKPTGSLVINIGDCFIGGGRGSAETRAVGGTRALGKGQAPPPNWKDLKKNGTRGWKANSTPHAVGMGNFGGIYKTKQLLSVSSFLYCRIVTETDFVCRGEHIWAKPNVPSPIRSRLKHSHEKLFWFVKDADKYYFDEKPWLKNIKQTTKDRIESSPETYNVPDGAGRAIKYFSREKDSPHADNINLSENSCFRSGKGEEYLKNKDTIEHSWRIIPVGAKQNGFELSGKGISEHIAPYPENLIRPYIEGMCPREGTILDPFLGSGTTMRVAMEENRNCVGIELKKSYIKTAKKRLNWGGALSCEYAEGMK